MLLTGLAIALTLAQAAPRQTAPQTDETIAVQRGGRLLVNNFAGEVIIRTWDKDALRVVARHQPRTKVSIRPGSSGVSISSSGSMGAGIRGLRDHRTGVDAAAHRGDVQLRDRGRCAGRGLRQHGAR